MGTEGNYTPYQRVHIKKKDKTKTGILRGDKKEKTTQEDQEQSRRRTTDEKDQTRGPGAIQKKDHNLATEGNTQLYTLTLSTNQ